MNDPIDPLQSARLEALERLCEGARSALPGDPSPCLARLGVESRGRVRDVLLGHRAAVDAPVPVVHWQTAPLAAVFFSHSVGEDYELEVEGRTLEGTVRARDLLTFERGALVEVSNEDGVFSRQADGGWRRVAERAAPTLPPRPEARRARPAGFSLPELDPAQQRAVDLPAGGALLVLGEAGCGKTTVALHRLASLMARARASKTAFRALVVLPTEGLRRLSEALLERLGAEGVEVEGSERGAEFGARRAFRDVPRRESREAPAGVPRVKRHPALRAALESLAARAPAHEAEADAPSVHATREDLHHLFGDSALMFAVAERAGGAIPRRAVEEVLAHTAVQFTETTEQASAHVDADRLATVDGLTIDRGTPTEDAGAIDPEDYAVLFALDRRRAKRLGRTATSPSRYDCVVVDEAQELAPLELELVGRAVARGGSLVVAGDAGQQVDSTAYFTDWTTTLAELGARRHESVSLEVSYRCPPSVTALARAVLDPSLPRPWAHGCGGAEVGALQAPSEGHLVALLGDSLRALRAEDPRATIAVIARVRGAAERLARSLGRALDVRLALDGDFRFQPGVEVTCVPEVKGLEFDYVVIPDASSSVYPDSPEARRGLYVAVTRPIERLLVACVGAWSPLLA